MLSDDVFQLLSIGLGLLALVLLLLVWSSVNRLRRSLESGTTQTSAGAWTGTAAEDTSSWQSATAPTTSEPAPAAEAVGATSTEPTPAAANTGTAVAAAGPATTGGGAAAAESVQEPAATAAPGATTGAAGTAAAGTAQAEDEPQEQPFERDGRWYFRRGDELLIYEEQTGQWVPAPEASAGGGASPVAAQSAATGAVGGGATVAAQTQTAAATGSFWKCPSCGAVNGSTAESCRMCFTARR